MNYENQLVLDGKINDVGAYIRTNIPNSYRLGIELQGAIKFNSWMNAAANISLSENKVKTLLSILMIMITAGRKPIIFLLRLLLILHLLLVELQSILFQ